jgi:hypothetical protein
MHAMLSHPECKGRPNTPAHLVIFESLSLVVGVAGSLLVVAPS